MQMLPIFRLGDNIGFDNVLSTRTKEKKPKWYIGQRGDINKQLESGVVLDYRFHKFFEFLDSTFWAESIQFFAALRRCKYSLKRYFNI